MILWSPSLIHIFHWASTVLCCSSHIYAIVFTQVAPSRQVLFTAKVPVFVLQKENSKLAFCNNFLIVLISLPTNVNMTNPVLLLYMLEEMGCICKVSGQWFFVTSVSTSTAVNGLLCTICMIVLIHSCLLLLSTGYILSMCIKLFNAAIFHFILLKWIELRKWWQELLYEK